MKIPKAPHLTEISMNDGVPAVRNANQMKNGSSAKKNNTTGWFTYVMTFGALICLYTYIPLKIGNISIPNISGFMFSSILLLLHYRMISAKLVGYLGLMSVLFISSIMASINTDYVHQMVQSILLFYYSIVLGLGIYAALSTFSVLLLRNTMFSLAIIILVGSVVEILTPLKVLTLAFTAYSPKAIGSFDIARDVLISGFYRPRFFASETSHAVAGFLLFMTCWIVGQENPRKLITYGACLLAAIIIFRSPTVLLGGLLWFPVAVLPKGGAISLNLKSMLIVVTGCLVVLAIAIGLQAILEARLNAGQDQSYLIRVVVAVDVALNAISAHPVLGFGIGGHYGAQELITQAMSDAGVRDPNVFHDYDSKLNNMFTSVFLYLGLFGGLLYWVLMAFISRSVTSMSYVSLTVIIALFGLVNGAIYSPKIWGYYFVVGASIRVFWNKGRLHCPH